MEIELKVKTKAKQEKIEKINEKSFIVWVKEAPEKGKANQAVIKVVAKFLKISQNNIKILRGKASSHKILEIDFAP
jgi:uncharacterized protein